MRRVNDGVSRGGAVAVGAAARKTARVLFAVIVVAALCLPAMVPAGRAHATSGSLTIAQTHNEDAVYNALQVFSAEVDSLGRATNVQWAGDSVKARVLDYLDEAGYEEWLADDERTYDGAHDNAQNAAEYISDQIQASQSISSAPTTKVSSSFAAGLARSLAERTGSTVTAGEATALDQGYYLVTTKASSIGGDDAATAPMWLVVGASTTATEKTAVPTVTAEAKHVTETTYARATDALAGQDLDFRITATMPNNLEAFDTYPVRLVIDNPSYYSASKDSVKVYVDGVEVTSQVTGDDGSINVASGDITVRLADLFTMPGSITKDSTVVVEYSATKSLLAKSSAGPVGVTASLEYRADPSKRSLQTSTASTANVYTFAANLLLRDLSTGRDVPGETYTIKVVDCPAAPDLVGKYIGGDGAVYDSAAMRSNSSEGGVTFGGLAAGTYEIRQTATATGYPSPDSVFTLTIAPTYDSTGAVTGLGATVSGGYAASVTGEGATHVVSVDVENSRVNIESGAFKMLSLPVTGLEGRAALYAIAGSLVAAGAVGIALAMRRRKGEDA